MQALCIWLLLLLQVLHLTSLSGPARPLTRGDLEEMEAVPAEFINSSSPCSATCGLGVKSQRLCFRENGEEVERNCRVRQVKCLEAWQCGLTTVTLTAGQSLEMDCLGHVMNAMGRYSWRVSWRYARGVVTSDNSLFSRWNAPQLDTVLLDPVREEDAGTYRCDIQDSALRRVKRVYWGVRVLPQGVMNLDYDASLAQWDQPETYRNMSTDIRTTHLYLGRTIRDMLLLSAGISSLLAGLILAALYWLARSRRGTGGAEEGRSRRGTF